MKLNSGLILTILVSLTLTACGTSKKEGPVVNEKPVEVAPVVDNTPQYVEGTNLTAEELRALGIMGNPLDEKAVYFEYNSTAIDRRSQVILGAHAYNLAKSAGTAVTLDGHADERGTRDYNLSLGERRAQVVSEFLAANGARSNNKTVSYGEERPVDSAHTEAAWAKNRRVEIKY